MTSRVCPHQIIGALFEVLAEVLAQEQEALDAMDEVGPGGADLGLGEEGCEDLDLEDEDLEEDRMGDIGLSLDQVDALRHTFGCA